MAQKKKKGKVQVRRKAILDQYTCDEMTPRHVIGDVWVLGIGRRNLLETHSIFFITAYTCDEMTPRQVS